MKFYDWPDGTEMKDLTKKDCIMINQNRRDAALENRPVASVRNPNWQALPSINSWFHRHGFKVTMIHDLPHVVPRGAADHVQR